ncbi:hypothetical protein ACN4GA_28980 [Raoultella terrigena]
MLCRVKLHRFAIGDIFICLHPQDGAQRRYILLISLEPSDIGHNPKKMMGYCPDKQGCAIAIAGFHYQVSNNKLT